jgi:hypothetical protein
MLDLRPAEVLAASHNKLERHLDFVGLRSGNLLMG